MSAIAITPRNQQVIDLLAEGCGNREIGKRLGMAERTVKQHIRNISSGAGANGLHARIRLLNALHPPKVNEAKLAGLTPKKRIICLKVIEGLSNQQIAEQLGNTEMTIKNHLRVIFDYVGASTRLELRMMVTL